MAQYKIPEPEDLLECPYDKVHMIRALKFPYHLMKCRRNYSGNDYASCPFNARHELPRPELRYHMTICPDKVVIEQDVLHQQQRDNEDGVYFKGCTKVPRYHSHDFRPADGEDWEQEAAWTPRIGVDPKVLQEKTAFKNLLGLTPLQKRKYHEKLLRNFQREKEGLPPVDSDDEEKPKEVVQSQPEPLREPHLVPKVLQKAPLLATSATTTPNPSVFSYSFHASGLGRGKRLARILQEGSGYIID